eukprot:g1713.t1
MDCEVLARARALCRVAASLPGTSTTSTIAGGLPGVRENLRYQERTETKKESDKVQAGPKDVNKTESAHDDASLALIARARALCADYRPKKSTSMHPWRGIAKKKKQRKKSDGVTIDKIKEIVVSKLPTPNVVKKNAAREDTANGDSSEKQRRQRRANSRGTGKRKKGNVSKLYLKLHRAVKLEKELASKDPERDRYEAEAKARRRERAEKYRQQLRQRMIREQNDLREKEKARLREKRKEEALRTANEDAKERRLMQQRARAKDRARARRRREIEIRKQEMEERESAMEERRARARKAKRNSLLALKRVKARRQHKLDIERTKQEQRVLEERAREEREKQAMSRGAASHLQTLRMLTKNRLRRAENKRRAREEQKRREEMERLQRYRERKRNGNMHIVRAEVARRQGSRRSASHRDDDGDTANVAVVVSLTRDDDDTRASDWRGYDEDERYIELGPPSRSTQVMSDVKRAECVGNTTSKSSVTTEEVDVSSGAPNSSVVDVAYPEPQDVQGREEEARLEDVSSRPSMRRRHKGKKRWKKPKPIDVPPESYFIKNGIGRVYASRESERRAIAAKNKSKGGYASLHANRARGTAET